VEEAQLPLAEKVSRADDVVDDSGYVSTTAEEVTALWERLTGRRSSR
jgi:dephospho-CoA kinase